MGTKHIRFLFLALVVIIGISIYANTFQNKFVWDDYFLIADNLFIRDIKFLPDIFTTDLHRFGLDRSNFYRPLQTMSFMMDYHIGKLNVLPYHITNLFLHLTSGALIYFIVLRLAKNDVISFLTSLIFVSHPVQTETVTYLSDRADLLAAVFIFGGFLSFLYYSSRKTSGHFIAINLCFISALLSKEISIIFPFLMLAWAALFKDGEGRRKLRPVFLSTASIGILYLILRLTVFHFKGNALGLDANEVFYVRFLTMLKALWRYFVVLVFPYGLHMERNFPWVRDLADPAVWAGIAFVVTGAILAKKAIQKEKVITFAVIWFCISLFPVSNIFPVNAIMSEHWLYLPSFSFALVSAYYITRIYEDRSHAARIALNVVLVTILCYYSYVTISRNTEWRDEETLYLATLRNKPDSARVHYNMGNVYAERQEYEKAIGYFEAAVRLDPDYAVAITNLGLAHFRLGEIDIAIDSYRKALKIKPDLANAHNSLGIALQAKGKEDEARSEYEKAIEYDPFYADPHNGLGIYFAKRGDLEKAIFHFKETLRIKPGHPDATTNLIRANSLKGNTSNEIE